MERIKGIAKDKKAILYASGGFLASEMIRDLEYCLENDLEVTEVYYDRATNGGEYDKKGLSDLVKQICQGQAGYLVINTYSTVTTSPYILGIILQLMEENLIFLHCSDKDREGEDLGLLQEACKFRRNFFYRNRRKSKKRQKRSRKT